MTAEEKKRLEDMETQIDTILQGIARIELGLFGDEQLGQKGLVARVESLEGIAKKFENAKWYVLGAIAVIGTVTAAAVWVIDLISNLRISG